MDNKEKRLLILKAFYEKKYNNKNVGLNSFELEGKHEAAYLLSSLERDGLLNFDGEVITSGGQRHPQYKNSVAMIWWSNVHITRDGELELKENSLI